MCVQFSVVHQGPVVAHISRVPDGTDIHSYDGSGEWVKIYTMGVEIRPENPVYWLPLNDYKGSPRVCSHISSPSPLLLFCIHPFPHAVQ